MGRERDDESAAWYRATQAPERVERAVMELSAEMIAAVAAVPAAWFGFQGWRLQRKHREEDRAAIGEHLAAMAYQLRHELLSWFDPKYHRLGTWIRTRRRAGDLEEALANADAMVREIVALAPNGPRDRATAMPVLLLQFKTGLTAIRTTAAAMHPESRFAGGAELQAEQQAMTRIRHTLAILEHRLIGTEMLHLEAIVNEPPDENTLLQRYDEHKRDMAYRHHRMITPVAHEATRQPTLPNAGTRGPQDG